MNRRQHSPLALSRTATYAVRAMSVLASLGPDETIRGPEIAEQIHAPKDYLSKVLRLLVLADLAEGNKGHHGGFRLAKPAAQITLESILDACNFDLETRVCVFGWPECEDDNPCPMHPAWSELRQEFVNWASRYRLSDVSTLEASDDSPDTGGSLTTGVL